jgi:hypothetical protein
MNEDGDSDLIAVGYWQSRKSPTFHDQNRLRENCRRRFAKSSAAFMAPSSGIHVADSKVVPDSALCRDPGEL